MKSKLTAKAVFTPYRGRKGIFDTFRILKLGERLVYFFSRAINHPPFLFMNILLKIPYILNILGKSKAFNEYLPCLSDENGP